MQISKCEVADGADRIIIDCSIEEALHLTGM